VQHAHRDRAEQPRRRVLWLRAAPVLPEGDGRGSGGAASAHRDGRMRAALLALLLALGSAAAADERVLDYQSDVLVRADGRIEVTETITVRAEGNRIRRGIYRDYPTRYKDRAGNDIEVDYEPLSVLRDGRPEAFRTERRANGVRTYFGSADHLLAPGTYTYTYRYMAGRLLGFLDTQDELSRNAT